MNQLIEKFIAESTICQGHPQIDGSYFDKEKFAELIVRECADLCDNLILKGTEHDLTYNDGVMDCAIILKQHFGVKE